MQLQPYKVMKTYQYEVRRIKVLFQHYLFLNIHAWWSKQIH